MKRRKLRVRQFGSRAGWEAYQLLQEKRWWGWKTIDRVDVPSFVKINIGCFGDNGGWVSPFAKYGRFGPDGLIHPQLEP